MCLSVVWSSLDGGEYDPAPAEKIRTPSNQPTQEEGAVDKTAACSEAPAKAKTPPPKLEVPQTPKRQRTDRHNTSTEADSNDMRFDWKLDTLANPPPLTPQERASFDAQMMPPPRSAASATPKRKRETKHSAYYEAWNPPSPTSFLAIAHTKSVLRKHNDEKAPWVVVPEAVKKRQV